MWKWFIGVTLFLSIVGGFCFWFAFHDQPETELVEAAYKGDLKKMQDLLDKGANINGRGMDDWTALTVAAREGNTEVIQFLIQHKASVNEPEGGGNTPLYWARFGKHEIAADLLIQYGALEKPFNGVGAPGSQKGL